MWNLPRTGLTLLMRRRSLFPELKRPLLACSKKDSPFSFFLFVAGIAFVTIWELLPSAIVMKIFYLIITTFFLPLNLAATGTLRGPPDEAEELQELEGLTTIELEDQDEEAKHLRSRELGYFENRYQAGCSDAVGWHTVIRPWGKPYQATYSARCNNPFDPNPVSFIAGTSDKNCDDDYIRNCYVDGNFVKCEITIAQHGADNGQCDALKVDFKIHVLCC
jgi:hypothetical protein